MPSVTGRVAAFYGPGKPMKIKQYAVPSPEPGAAVLEMTVANVCGSDLHQWRGEFDVEKSVTRPAVRSRSVTGSSFDTSIPVASAAPAPSEYSAPARSRVCT